MGKITQLVEWRSFKLLVVSSSLAFFTLTESAWFEQANFTTKKWCVSNYTTTQRLFSQKVVTIHYLIFTRNWFLPVKLFRLILPWGEIESPFFRLQLKALPLSYQGVTYLYFCILLKKFPQLPWGVFTEKGG